MKSHRMVIILIIVTVILLSACGIKSGSSTTVPLATDILPTASTGVITESASLPTLQSSTYPAPDSSQNTELAPNGSYPAPTEAVPENVYPSPSQESTSETPQTNDNPGATTQGSNVQNLTPSAMVVRTDLKATDPATVKLAGGKPQMIEFFAFWCPNCKSMAPVINTLETKYRDKINFVYLDIDNSANTQFKKALGYTVQPEFFLLDADGKILNHWLGIIGADELDTALSSVK